MPPERTMVMPPPRPKLFNVLATDVTSSTRATWSESDVEIFESFINGNQQLDDINPLVEMLNLSRFSTVANFKGELLGPIIEVKVRRKLAAVSANLRRRRQPQTQDAAATAAGPPNSTSIMLLPLSPPQPPPNGRTRLQAARADALADGREPPTELPKPDPIYTPEIWKEKKRRGLAAKAQQKSWTSTDPDQLNRKLKTITQTKQYIAELEKELTAARLRLQYLEDQEKKGPGKKQQGHRKKEELTEEGSDGDDVEEGDETDLSSENNINHPQIDTPASPHGTVRWSPPAVAAASDQKNKGASHAAVVAEKRDAKNIQRRQRTGTDEPKNKKANTGASWIGKGSRSAALANALFGSGPVSSSGSGSGSGFESGSDSDPETSQQMDKLSAYLDRRFGGHKD